MKKIIFSVLVLFLGLSIAQAESLKTQKKCNLGKVTNSHYGMQYLRGDKFESAVCSMSKFNEPKKAPENFNPRSYKGSWHQGLQYLTGEELKQALYLMGKK